MKGDYLRYKAEVLPADAARQASSQSIAAYNTAASITDQSLPPTHPIRLGMALSFATFNYEILNNPKEACRLAKRAFDAAIAELDSIPEDTYKVPDITL